LDDKVIKKNTLILENVGLFSAKFEAFGRLSFRSLTLDKDQLCNEILSKWEQSIYSPNWYQINLIDAVQRVLPSIDHVSVVLIEQLDENQIGKPRTREWREESGFVNIFQGRDNDAERNKNAYMGDRAIAEHAFETGVLTLQVHRLQPKETNIGEVFVPALFLGNRKIVRKKNGI
jgi:hypothetical protein